MRDVRAFGCTIQGLAERCCSAGNARLSNTGEGALLQSSLLLLGPFSSQYPVDALAKPLGEKKQCLDGRRPLPALYLRKVPLIPR